MKSWPDGRRFAFTIFDDTDWATREKVKPVYDLLAALGIGATKSVWMFKGEGAPSNEGATCEEHDYLEWITTLKRQGFEIGLHNVAPTTSSREWTQRGLDRFRELFGAERIIHCNHLGCQENIYWGAARLTGWRRAAYNTLTRRRNARNSRGHVEGDELFWGDLCRERISYVRNFVFNELNTLGLCPQMPYHDPAKPYVNYWFASANGSSLPRFLANFTFENIDRLVAEGGLCVAYVHFAAGFAPDGEVDPEFQRRLEYIAAQDGWFPTVSEALDYLRAGEETGGRTISDADLRRLEMRWLASKVVGGTS